MICIDLNHKLPVWQYGKLCGVKCFKIKLARTVRDLQNTQMYIVSLAMFLSILGNSTALIEHYKQ